MRAGLVVRPEDYRWSSHCFNALGRDDPLLSAHHEYEALGKNQLERQQAYRDLLSSHWMRGHLQKFAAQ
jgi:putative transposase